MLTPRPPLIIGLGGTMRAGSTSEQALKVSLQAAEREGARTIAFTGRSLMLPLYNPADSIRSPEASLLVSRLRECDGVIISSPGYHGLVSGMIKNALDYVEDLREDRRPYLHDRAVGCIVCAYGWQAVGSTLGSLRTVTHALRGWPTPFGAGINSATGLFDEEGRCLEQTIQGQLETVGRQVTQFARVFTADRRKMVPVPQSATV